MIPRRALLFLFLLALSHSSAGRMVDPLYQARQTLNSALVSNRFAEKINTENIVNADTVSTTPGGDPYTNKLVVVRQVRNPQTGALELETGTTADKTPYELEYNPQHPGADPETGLLKKPNVRPQLALANAKQTALQTAALSQVAQNIKFMDMQIVDLMKGQ